MNQRTRRDYVFKVTITYEGDAPKPDAHELRRHVVAALVESFNPVKVPCPSGDVEMGVAVPGSNSVVFQVQCTGNDCRLNSEN